MPQSSHRILSGLSAAAWSQHRLSEDLEITEIEDFATLERLRPEWEQLWRETPSTPFQSPMWLIPWARHFAQEPHVLTFRKNGLLVGLVPFYICMDPGQGRKLLLLGAGLSDYLDLLARPEFRPAILRALKEWLAEQQDLWTHCDFFQLPTESLLLQLAPNSCQRGDDCPVLPLHCDVSVNDLVPPRQLEKLRYYRRRAEKEGPFEIHEATPDNCREIMQTLFSLHAARWRSQGTPGVLQDPEVQQFHLAVAQEMARSGILRLYSATHERKTFAVLYAFASHRRTCFYLSGFDPAFEKLSPGTLLIGHAIEQARADSDSFDFLRGHETYKYAWGAQNQPTWNLTFR